MRGQAQKKPTMKSITSFTNYANNDTEYLFCVKGRPFPCLVSQSLPSPSSTLIDFNLIHGLGLKMTNLMCQKFSFAGHKLRILGRISTNVQCVIDGVAMGRFNLKATVVKDLEKNLDTECVASANMAAQLQAMTTIVLHQVHCLLLHHQLLQLHLGQEQLLLLLHNLHLHSLHQDHHQEHLLHPEGRRQDSQTSPIISTTWRWPHPPTTEHRMSSFSAKGLLTQICWAGGTYLMRLMLWPSFSTWRILIPMAEWTTQVQHMTTS